jgi:predicted MFS family arabinose efflux permease
MFLFGSRDVWFVVALPVYLASTFNWDHWYVGGFLALWVIGYGFVQGIAPNITGKKSGKTPDGRHALGWAIALGLVTVVIAIAMTAEFYVAPVLIIGLMIFGALFAVNSSLHSYLIVSYAGEDGVSLDVGFYYMANAMGRLIGTILSGWLFQAYGLVSCLWVSAAFILITAIISIGLPKHKVVAVESSA